RNKCTCLESELTLGIVRKSCCCCYNFADWLEEIFAVSLTLSNMGCTKILVYFLVAAAGTRCFASILPDTTTVAPVSTEPSEIKTESSPYPEEPAVEIEAVPLLEQIEEISMPDGTKETVEIIPVSDISSLASLFEDKTDENNFLPIQSNDASSSSERQARGLGAINLRYTTPFRATPVVLSPKRESRHYQHSNYNGWNNRWDSNNYNYYNRNNYQGYYGYPSYSIGYNRYPSYTNGYNRYPSYSNGYRYPSYPSYNGYNSYRRPVLALSVG
ncbi:unnamed protein product, partial [Allacma fusca]